MIRLRFFRPEHQCFFRNFNIKSSVAKFSSLHLLPKIYNERQQILLEGNLSHAYPAFNLSPNVMTPNDVLIQFEKNPSSLPSLVKVPGRVLSIRNLSQKLVFIDIYHDGVKLQIILNSEYYNSEESFKYLLESLQRGDLIEAEGSVFKTKSGEISIKAKNIFIVAPCLQNIPSLNAPEMTEEHRSRWRHLDLISNPQNIKIFKLRSSIIREIRKFLDENQFTEIETPILSNKAGGAIAKPFKTELAIHNTPLFLRIAMELPLKQLITAGFNKIYELGKVFRNEGLDATHNPEFTMLEMYQSYASCKDMAIILHKMLLSLARSVLNTDKISSEEIEIDFSQPFKIIEIMPALEASLKKHVDLSMATSELMIFLKSLLNEHGINYNKDKNSTSYLIDKLIGHFIEPACVQPTLLINHPIIQSPLARAHPTFPFVADRFELFIYGKEISNGYSELNNPHEQRLRFHNQSDSEEHASDEEFVKVLEAGMPPTAGCGIGIDRLTMLFAGKKHIRDVILFPLMKPIL